jgi:hypothetical protein
VDTGSAGRVGFGSVRHLAGDRRDLAVAEAEAARRVAEEVALRPVVQMCPAGPHVPTRALRGFGPPLTRQAEQT